MYRNLVNGITHILTGAGILPSTVVQVLLNTEILLVLRGLHAQETYHGV